MPHNFEMAAQSGSGGRLPPTSHSATISGGVDSGSYTGGNISNCFQAVIQPGYYSGGCWYQYQTAWMGYPVYYCSDKTAKSIEILKALQKDKLIECKSVPKFIELVEKIAAIL